MEFENRLRNLTKDKRLNLILHTGTPKTGTTSIQLFLNAINFKLKESGYLYSQISLHSSPPKHQWIVSNLLSNNFESFFQNIKYVYQEAEKNQIKTIILSTEGVFNHWWDYSDEAKAILNILSKYFSMSIWIFFREPQSFLESFYKQNLKNPQIDLVECYGKDLSFKDMLGDKWFIKHLDYLGFVYDCECIFGKDNIKVFNYSKDIIKEIIRELNINIKYDDIKRENIGQSSIAVELLRVINRYKLNIEDKAKIIKELSSCDKILGKYTGKIELIDDDSRQDILDKFYLQSLILKNRLP